MTVLGRSDAKNNQGQTSIKHVYLRLNQGKGHFGLGDEVPAQGDVRQGEGTVNA